MQDTVSQQPGTLTLNPNRLELGFATIMCTYSPCMLVGASKQQLTQQRVLSQDPFCRIACRTVLLHMLSCRCCAMPSYAALFELTCQVYLHHSLATQLQASVQASEQS